jgi:hypothetical protein
VRAQLILTLVALAPILHAQGSGGPDQPLTPDLLGHVPGHRKPVPFNGTADPFLDLAATEPARIEAKTVLSSAEQASRTFAANVTQLLVTNVVLANDPSYRAVVIDGVPLSQGQTMPMEMFATPLNGSVVVKEITSTSIILEYTGLDTNRATAALPYSLTYSRHRAHK